MRRTELGLHEETPGETGRRLGNGSTRKREGEIVDRGCSDRKLAKDEE